MKKLIYSLIALAAVIMWLPANANRDSDFRRSEQFAFDVNSNSLLELFNHNGNVVIENTSESRLNIEATVTGRARDLEEAKRITQKIKVIVKTEDG
ncbi:MAG: hypothetical protein II671_07745, partial [Salinivirgaceae bacterium]|nr:hypothetical protein [Salinivirgaceae bacterium]